MINMKLLKICIVASITLLVINSCDKETEKPYQCKSYTLNLCFDGNKTDTIVNVTEPSSPIIQINNHADWLKVEKNESAQNANILNISCMQNNTTSMRNVEINAICDNKDTLKLNVSQTVIMEQNVIHNTVTDQPAFAPNRLKN